MSGRGFVQDTVAIKGPSRRLRHSDELSIQVRRRYDAGVDAGGKGHVIEIDRARDDARVRRRATMLAVKVDAVQRQNGASLGRRVPNHLVIRDALVSLAGRERRQHVVTQTAEFIDDWLWEIFVRIEPCHARSVLPGLGCDLLLDLGGVAPVVIPDRVQIVSGESGEIVQQVRVDAS